MPPAEPAITLPGMKDFGRYTTTPRPSRDRRGHLFFFGVLLLACTLGVAAAAGEARWRETGPGVDEDPRELAQKGLANPEPVDLLVLGVDRRPGDVAEGVRADTIMLVRIFPASGDVNLLSVPRDLFLEIRPGERDRINAAYAYGGVRMTVAALEEYTGVGVDHYAVVDFRGFEEMVDAMGGVTVRVEEELPPGWHIGRGVQHLDGRQALLYARYRSTPGGDLDRIQRQQELLAALRSRALRWDLVVRLPEMVSVARRYVSTDLSPGEALSLSRVVLRHGRGATMTSRRLAGEPQTLPDGRQVLLPDDGENRRLVRAFLTPPG
ncbi:Polyisoprenyl-teichoic acid--peptidoglycan teichoic acid transferase TagU [Rubrobacter xylanophilus DSM 9941]|uniref:LCP family protein n=1 Tax=Rubrobacter xylanophilus TaxID=49319 RepID=UPI001C63EED1|nr:LCP family protein [Rubrobacter xylanophilus]QYJ14776.1 Polyisoprenyl-teichoic acid--peptidoglycan teichoic acid transferase TagU [Rubrobacter xylanophilus DSM 9941]